MDLEDFLAHLSNTPRHRRIYYAIRRALRKPHDWENEIKWGWQRARHGYSEADTWGFDFYLSGVIAGGLQRIRDRGIGYPNGMTFEEWNAKLGEMIAGFEAARHAMHHMEEPPPEFERGAALFVQHYFSLWD